MGGGSRVWRVALTAHRSLPVGTRLIGREVRATTVYECRPKLAVGAQLVVCERWRGAIAQQDAIELVLLEYAPMCTHAHACPCMRLPVFLEYAAAQVATRARAQIEHLLTYRLTYLLTYPRKLPRELGPR